MIHPLVTVITPTTEDRIHFNKRIRSIYLEQDYPNREHIFDYGNGLIGQKRNRLCEKSNGEIIVHFDSDDWYACDWISNAVNALILSGKQVIGLGAFYLFDPDLNKYWKYTYPNDENIVGGTFCYYKSFWEQNKFLDLHIGEDNHFVRGKDFAVNHYQKGFIATIHKGNTSKKNIEFEERYVECEF